jgi:acyl-CoA synthetase (AMP-forming)/AMP-acid ligase II
VLTHCIGRFDPLSSCASPTPTIKPAQWLRGRRDPGRGALLFAGYFGEPEATRAAFTADGWLHTGDLAEQRPDGHVELRGRLKEMIKSGGYNVYPREVEWCSNSHPAVAQVVVLGLPDERYGEAVHAVLTLRGHRVTAAALDALCRRSWPTTRCPRASA